MPHIHSKLYSGLLTQNTCMNLHPVYTCTRYRANNLTNVTTAPPNNPSETAFITASVVIATTVVIVIVVPVIILLRATIKDRRNAERERREQEARRILQRQTRRQRSRPSVTEPVPATFDWHHSIHVEGSLPPSYADAEKLPPMSSHQKQRWSDGGENRTDSRAPLINRDSEKDVDRSHEMSTKSVSTHPQNTGYGATDITQTVWGYAL